MMTIKYSPRLPNDVTKTEKAIISVGAARIYKKLPSDRLRVVTALVFELGYNECDVASIYGVDQSAISLDVRKIKNLLLKDYESS